ncbi:MAG TPA: YIP1 family protein [Thermoanaerobaculia bacterium]|nr:YIP1 family protein [Thermoanaerobaculia bacterium]
MFSRVAGVLFAPAEAFGEIARRPDILAPLLLIVALGYVSTLLVVPRFDQDAYAAEQASEVLRKQPGTAAADADRMGRVVAASTKVGLWLAPLLTIVICAVMAGLYLFAFRLMAGEGTYTEAFSVMLYAWLPFAIGGIIMGIVVLARGSFSPMEAATLVKSNPAFLVDLKEQPALFALLSSFDLFSVWMLVLLVFGFSAVSKLPRKTSAIIVLVLWVCYALVKTGGTALMASLTAP